MECEIPSSKQIQKIEHDESTRQMEALKNKLYNECFTRSNIASHPHGNNLESQFCTSLSEKLAYETFMRNEPRQHEKPTTLRETLTQKSLDYAEFVRCRLKNKMEH